MARKGLLALSALAVVACAVTFPGLANLVFALGLEVIMYVIFMYMRDRVTLRVPLEGSKAYVSDCKLSTVDLCQKLSQEGSMPSARTIQ